MDHRYIEQHSLADRYLEHALPPPERAAFEAHLVDCQECTDRVLLAEMFHNRNGAPAVKSGAKPEPKPLLRGARVVAAFTPWQRILLLSGAILLFLIPCGFFLWELRSLRP